MSSIEIIHKRVSKQMFNKTQKMKFLKALKV